jgi:hypothetical protein
MTNNTYKIVHHHFTGDFNIIANQPQNPLNNTLLFNIKGHQIFFRFNKIENINNTDKKFYIDKIEYTREFPQDIINLFNTLGMMNTPTVFYLVYNMDFKVYYLKNTNTTTVFMLK